MSHEFLNRPSSISLTDVDGNPVLNNQIVAYIPPSKRNTDLWQVAAIGDQIYTYFPSDEASVIIPDLDFCDTPEQLLRQHGLVCRILGKSTL